MHTKHCTYGNGKNHWKTETTAAKSKIFFQQTNRSHLRPKQLPTVVATSPVASYQHSGKYAPGMPYSVTDTESSHSRKLSAPPLKDKHSFLPSHAPQQTNTLALSVGICLPKKFPKCSFAISRCREKVVLSPTDFRF